MGAGKTSVGRALSKRLGMPFMDLDDVVESREGKSIPEMFQELGEAGFRQAEAAALRELCLTGDTSPKIVALGGGAFVQPQNAALIKSLNITTVFLDGPWDELLRRCLSENRVRPLCQEREKFRQLYEARREFYLKARCRVETAGKDVEAVAAEVACSLELE
jgi:shikimate kinase